MPLLARGKAGGYRMIRGGGRVVRAKVRHRVNRVWSSADDLSVGFWGTVCPSGQVADTRCPVSNLTQLLFHYSVCRYCVSKQRDKNWRQVLSSYQTVSATPLFPPARSTTWTL